MMDEKPGQYVGPPSGVSKPENPFDEVRNEENYERSEKDSKVLEKIAGLLEPVSTSAKELIGSQLEQGSLADDATTRLSGGLSKLTEDTKEFARRSFSELRNGYSSITNLKSEIGNKLAEFFIKSEEKSDKYSSDDKEDKQIRLFGSGVPTEEEMRKADRGAAYLGDKLDELLGHSGKSKKKKEEEDGEGGLGGILSGLTGGGLGGILSSSLSKGMSTFTAFSKSGAGKALSIGSLAIGLYQAVGDAVAGVIKSEDWGVSKISGGAGGFLGGMGSGLKNAFSNAGKWGLIGFGIGNLIVPGIGGIVGGIAGGILGGLLGFFGGEKIAKALDGVGAWVSNWFTKTLPKAFMGAMSFLGKKLMDFGSFAMDNGFNPINMVINGVIKPAISFIGDWVSNNKDTNEVAGILDSLFSSIGNFFKGIGDTFAYYAHIYDKEGFTGLAGTLGQGIVANFEAKDGNVHKEAKKQAAFQGTRALGVEGILDKKGYEALDAEQKAIFDNATASFFESKGLEAGVSAFATGGVVNKPTMAMIGETGESEWVVPEKYLPKALTDGSFKAGVDTKVDTSTMENLLKDLIIAVKSNGSVPVIVPMDKWTTIN